MYIDKFLNQVPGPISLLVLVFFFFLLFFSLFWLGRPLPLKLRLSRFKSDRDGIWQEYSSSEYASTDRVGFRIWRHTFKMVVMTSFREKPLARRDVYPSTRSIVHSCLFSICSLDCLCDWLLYRFSLVQCPVTVTVGLIIVKLGHFTGLAKFSGTLFWLTVYIQ